MTTPPVDEDGVVGPSDRSFGLVFAAVFALVAVVPLWRGDGVRLWAVGLAGTFAAAALAAPVVLAPLNRVWLHVGLAMHRVVNPIVMGLLYYAAVTPVGLVRQALRRGLSRRLRFDPASPTYWIDRRREPFSPMDRQF